MPELNKKKAKQGEAKTAIYFSKENIRERIENNLN